MSPDRIKIPTRKILPDGLVSVTAVAEFAGIAREKLVILSQDWPDINTVPFRSSPNSRRTVTCILEEDIDTIARRVVLFQAGQFKAYRDHIAKAILQKQIPQE